MHKLHVQTQARSQFLNITAEVQDAIQQTGVRDGVVTVFVPHTTGGVMINENADPDVCHDLLAKLERLVPERESYYQHAEGNSDAHLKAALMGSSVQVMVEDGRLCLGTWQGIYFAEFDGPRTREVWVKAIAG